MNQGTPKRRRSAWFAFYPDDFAGGTRGMSMAAKGAFVDLLAYQFANGAVPSDDRTLCRIIGAFPDEWQEIREEVLSKFEEEEGALVNRRMQKERDERNEIREKRIEAVSKRWNKSDTSVSGLNKQTEYKSNDSVYTSPSPSPSPSTTKSSTKTKEENPLTPKGGSRRCATPSAVDLISSIPDDFPESYRPFAEEWAHDKQSRNTKQRFQSDRAFLTSINRMLKYPRSTVADAVEMAIAGGWQGWEQDNIKLGSKVQNIKDTADIVESWSSPNPQPDLDELFDIKRIARERDEEAAQIAGEEPEFEMMEETSCF
jgi:uncharacterized protein YdaU (DUF1376 family)